MAEEKEFERIYVIPLMNVRHNQYSRAAPKAVKAVRRFLIRHMKVEDESNIWIDDSLNKALWARGKYKIPNKIRVRAVKFEDGVVEASLPEFAEKKSRRELLKEEKAKKEPILRKEEAEEGEGETTGAEDYNISPSADGGVKIKKKKEHKPKEEETEKSAEDVKEKPEKTKEKTKDTKKPGKTTKEKKKPAAKKKSEKTEPKSKSKTRKVSSKKEK